MSAEFVLERLAFRAPGLSRRLKRLISNRGRGFIEAKLKDLQERFDIANRKVVAAYSSLSESACRLVSGLYGPSVRLSVNHAQTLSRAQEKSAARPRFRRVSPSGLLGRYERRLA